MGHWNNNLEETEERFLLSEKPQIASISISVEDFGYGARCIVSALNSQDRIVSGAIEQSGGDHWAATEPWPNPGETRIPNAALVDGLLVLD